MTIDIEHTATAFANARLNAQGLLNYPGLQPTTMAPAYAMQDQIVRHIGQPIGGWKVGRIPQMQAEALGSDRLSGPIFEAFVHIVATDEVREVPIYAEGFAAALIDDIRVGIEIASPPLFVGINDNGAAVTASDLGNTKALVIGTAIDLANESDYTDWQVTLGIDGVQIGEGQARDLPDGSIGAVRFLLEHLAVRGIALTAGQWVSTGAITGVHQAKAGQNVVARFGDKYTVSCKVGAAQPI